MSICLIKKILLFFKTLHEAAAAIGDAAIVKTVVDLFPLLPADYDFCPFQNIQVVGDGRLFHAELLAYIGYAEFFPPQHHHYLNPGWVGYGLEKITAVKIHNVSPINILKYVYV